MAGTLTRRQLLAGAAGVAAGLGAAAAEEAAAAAPLRALYHRGRLPLDRPSDPAWRRASPARVQLFPQQMVLPYLKGAGVRRLTVRSLYSDDELGFLLEWRDTHANQEDTLARFHDAAAIQLPCRAAKEPPPFTMGGRGRRVHIFQWRASWQADMERGGGYEERVAASRPRIVRDVAPQTLLPPAVAHLWTPALAVENPVAVARPRTAVDEIVAEGYGTATSVRPSRGRGWGEHRGRRWRVAIGLPLARRPVADPIRPGSTWPVAFAVWLGGRGNRGGRKHWALWVDCYLVPA